ncbi:flagellar hook-basal body complex protein FliE [Desulfovibrio sp. OttesenSCG-928-A18]|nr:flagellar hook-basal body complex protein FliE [Desulfovibrio sp. OttesenSCG-928-A18]
MSIQAVGLKAYNTALQNFAKAEKKIGAELPGGTGVDKPAGKDFSEVLTDSLSKVNSLQGERSSMIQAFASGQKQNVHELMITMQKASLAMNLTSAVRNKVIEAYKDITRMQF